jgi:2-polyprenyl-3-methyl-5-hydroxy-6-metoxy-1,4-benzoquinol methylase
MWDSGRLPIPPTATSQEKYRDPNPVVSFVIRRFFRRIRSVVAELDPRTVLDAGCGEGELLRRKVLPPAIAVSCLDLSTGSLAEVRSHSTPRNLICGSVLSLPLAPASFDVVLCLEVLEHLEDPRAAVHEVARAARQAIVFSVPWEPWFRVGNVFRGKHLTRLGNHPEHIHHWNPRTFRAFLAESFSDIRVVEAFPWIIACCRPSGRLSG